MQRATLLLAILTLVLVGGLAYLVREQTVIYQARVRTLSQTMNTQWKSMGISHSVSTIRGGDETEEDFLKRHDAVLKKALEMYPPDPR